VTVLLDRFRSRFLARERPLKFVPPVVAAALAVSLLGQVAWHGLQPRPVPVVSALKPPPASALLRVAAFGDQVTLSRLLMLWLQSFDYQPGISIPFKNLNYRMIIAWLGRILDLDPRSQYPLLSAARVYSLVPDNAKKREMLAFVERRFLKAPNERWPWMAHAIFVAKHQLKDMKLALRLARELRTRATGPNVPYWAKQMELFVLDDMGDQQDAKILLGGLIASGQITDPNQIRFLMQRLNDTKKK
jgi:hypothetical protein